MISSAPTVDIAHSPYEFNLSDESPKKIYTNLWNVHMYIHMYGDGWM